MNALLGLLGMVHGAVVSLRNQLYELEILPSRSVSRPVLSVGNLVMGGTGKTPMISFLLELLSERGVRAAVVSRGYGGTYRGVAKLPKAGSLSEAARIYGDEPAWLSFAHKTANVYVGRDRLAAARFAIGEEPDVQILLLDDGFQHRRLRRELNLVMVDSSAPLSDARMFPRGRGREGLGSLARANAIILNKINLSVPERVKCWAELISEHAGQTTPIYRFACELAELVELKTQQLRVAESLRGQRVVLLSALARPQAFEDLVRRACGVEVRKHFCFKDHHRFTAADVAAVRRATGDGEWIIITQKDAVKFDPSWHEGVLVTQLALSTGEQTREEIYALVKQILATAS